jgi:hypothetical protein
MVAVKSLEIVDIDAEYAFLAVPRLLDLVVDPFPTRGVGPDQNDGTRFAAKLPTNLVFYGLTPHFY